jgi:hypothetical protein
VRKPEGKRPLRLPRYRCEGNIVTCVWRVIIDEFSINYRIFLDSLIQSVTIL